MSRSSPDRDFMRRTMIISGSATIPLSVLIFLLATGLGPVSDFITFLGPVITGIIAITLLALLFVSLMILLGNIREWYHETAGWFDVLILFILVVVIAVIGFSPFHAFLTALLCIGFVYYLYMAQE